MAQTLNVVRAPGAARARVFVVCFCALAAPVRAAGPATDILLNCTTVREHQPAGAIVGILKSVDPDPGEIHYYSLVPGEGDTDNAFFSLGVDTLRTKVVLDYATNGPLHVRIRTMDGVGYTFDKPFAITVTPPEFVAGFDEYFAANPTVSNASVGLLERELLDYFWVYQHVLAARGALDLDVPASTPADSATSGTASVYLSGREFAKIFAAKTAHAIWLDKEALVPWRLRDFAADHLKGLFARTNVFNLQSVSNFYFMAIVDHSPSEAYRYAWTNGLIRGSVTATIQAVLEDVRSDFIHGSSSYGDPSCAQTLTHALGFYSTNRWRPNRIARVGCHSSSRIILALLRSVNIPGFETANGAYYLAGHSEAVWPCVGRVLPHGDHIYSAALTATPVAELMPSLQFFADNLSTPPCSGNTYRVAKRHEALNGTAYPTPTMLGGVRNPAAYGYTSAVAFLSGYAGWNQGLTEAELAQAADTLLTQFNETRRLDVPKTSPRGYVLDSPSALDFPTNSRVSLRALPKPGYAFRQWTGDAPAGGETANPLILAMDRDRTLEAVFTRPPVTLWLADAPGGGAGIRFLAQTGVVYTVEYRNEMDSGAWQRLADLPPPPTAGVVTATDPAMPAQPRRFYRVHNP